MPFSINGTDYALRQPTPLEVDRIIWRETMAMDWVQRQPDAEELKQQPVTPGLLQLRELYAADLERQYQEAGERGDTDGARAIAEEMERFESSFPANRLEERARNHMNRVRNREIINVLLSQPDGRPLTDEQREQFKLATLPDPVDTAAGEAARRIVELMTFRPNSGGRSA